MKRKLLGAAAAACLAITPALAYSQGPPSARVEAQDSPPAWSPSAVTITAGQSVAFAANGNTQHYMEFAGPAKPSCNGVPLSYTPSKQWSGTCTFAVAGDYTFRCPLHDIPPHSTMRGTLHVAEPTETATPTPEASASPGATATPVPDATPTPTPVAQTQNQPKTLSVKLARSQKGARLRGSVLVEQAKSKLEVVVRAKLGRKTARIGRWSAKAAGKGTRRFNVTLSAAARHVLASKRLKLSVAVTLTPPAGKKLSRKLTVRMRG